MIIHHDDRLQPQQIVTFASPEYTAWLRAQPDARFVDLAEDWPLEQIALERDEAGAVRAFHVPPEGIRREIAQRSADPDAPAPVQGERDLETERAALLARIDVVFGRQVQLRYPLAGLHAAKRDIARSAPALLTAEAEARGLAIDDLAAAIETEAARQAEEILALDADRLAVKRAARAATTLADLDAIGARIGG